MKRVFLIQKKGYIGAALLLVLSNVLKVSSIIILCTTHAQHPEVPHDSESVIEVKKLKTTTHRPIL